MSEMKDLGLYLHLPFCVRKCSYCDFLSFPADEEKKAIYASALIREIRGYAGSFRNRRVSSIFLGGGTPSVMPAKHLEAVFRAVYESFPVAEDAEITMEVNPGTLNEKLLSFIFDHINRVSLGVQSFRDEELTALGRIHGAGEARQSIRLLRECGVRNLNLDLMYGIPGQTEETWRDTLGEALSFEPSHISAYSLIVEEGTPFFRMREKGTLVLPDEDAERGMYAAAEELLSVAGFRRYEISNYARPGFHSRHNCRYWKRQDCLGLGLGAASLVDRMRWRNTRGFDTYIAHSAEPQQLVRDMDELTRSAEAEEFMFLGLRMTEGISAEEFRRTIGLELRTVYGGVLDRLASDELLAEIRPGRFALTERGFEVSNRVLAEFLLT